MEMAKQTWREHLEKLPPLSKRVPIVVEFSVRENHTESNENPEAGKAVTKHGFL